MPRLLTFFAFTAAASAALAEAPAAARADTASSAVEGDR